MTNCTGTSFATPAEYNEYWRHGFDLTAFVDSVGSPGVTWEEAIQFSLDLAAADIQISMQASGQCDCSLAPFAANFLKRMNIIWAAVGQDTVCAPDFSSDEDRLQQRDQVQAQLAFIQTNELTLCQGDTSKNIPAIAWAEVAWTPENAAQIDRNRIQRESE